MNPPTKRQLQVLRCISRHMKKERCAPTMRELRAALGVASCTGILGHLKALEKKGFLKLGRDRKARAIQLLDTTICPCCGSTIAKEVTL